MARFEAFREALQEALIHLHDPNCELPPFLYAAAGCAPNAGPGPVQAEIVRSIGALRPALDLARGSRAWREYQILYHRFVLGLTVEEAADQLYLARRTLQRAQREALHALALRMWRDWQEGDAAGAQTDASRAPAVQAAPRDQSPDWRAQVQQELVWLQTGAPGTLTDLGQVIRDVLEMGPFLTQRPGIWLELGFVQPEVMIGLHPSALRQMLVTAVRRLAAHAAAGPITIYGGLENGQARATLTAVFDEGQPPPGAELVGDILLPNGASVDATLKENTVYLTLRLRSSEALTVLVVDDNPDIVHFYRRCLAGTSFRIIQVEHASELFGRVKEIAPQAIVLDIMLPDTDGWKLLTQLYENPATRGIPVVVCTVVREEELALSLGAAAYLAKPVDAQAFVGTLDRVTGRV